jgi:hypothetical protein
MLGRHILLIASIAGAACLVVGVGGRTGHNYWLALAALGLVWACPGFVDRRGLGIRVSDLTAFCPPLWGNLLVRPRASFRPGLYMSDAVVSSGCQGRPARQRCGLPQCFQAAP